MTFSIPLSDLAPGSSTVHRIGRVKVLLSRIGDEVHATSAVCTHARVELSAGRLTPDCLVECPMHGALFSPVDGAVHEGPAITPLPTYPVRVVDGRVHVDVGPERQIPSSAGASAASATTTPGARPSMSGWGTSPRPN